MLIAAGTAGVAEYAAAAQWCADLPERVRVALGLGRSTPALSTLRRAAGAVDPDVLDAVLSAWVATRAASGLEGHTARRVIAVDGKSARGAVADSGRCEHFLSAMDQASGAVLAQVRVDAATNEIAMFKALLDHLPLAGALITADALHTQVGHAHYLHRHGAQYLLVVKANQPRLHKRLAGLPWRDIPTAVTSADAAHGRIQERAVQITSLAGGIGFPHAKLALRIRRTRRQKRRRTTAKVGAGGHDASTEVVYAVTDLAWEDTTAEELAAMIRGHWGIENRVHWVRDVTFGEDASQTRTGTSVQVMTTIRNTAISLLRLVGHTNIAAATRRIHRHPERLLRLIQ